VSWEENLEVLTQRNAVITLHVSNMKEDGESYAEAKEAKDTDDVRQNYAYRTKEKKRKSKKNKRGRRATTSYSDEDLLWANEKARKELFLQSRSGTLFAFLDELEPHLGKYMLHRSTLSRQKEASVVFDRERRPGIVSLDIDFAENLDIEEAMKVQSEHWSSNQCTLFMMIAQFLDVNEWNKKEGLLDISAHVTVKGEEAGSARAVGSFWGKVTSGPHRAPGAIVDTYFVEDAKGELHQISRSDLRHRVFVKQAHAGVTGDKKHDSYSMRHFVATAVKHLKDQRGCDARSIWTSQLLTVLCVHSDNAAQHFKSSKSLHWLSKQIEGMGYKSVLWDFGPPGHGKGEWV